MLKTLRRAVIVLPLAWTGVWLGYYAAPPEIIFGFNNSTVQAAQCVLPEVIKFGELLKTKFKTVSVMGYCWGGKITPLALASSTSPFHSGASVHPALLVNADGDNLARPLAFFPSKDEPADVVKHIVDAINSKPFAKECEFHLYDTVHHGWAAARADLSDPENRKQYDDVYQRLADYFARVNTA